MKALVIHGRLDARVEERPEPVPGDGQVRLRLAYAGICGSDLHYFHDGAVGAFTVTEPLVPGHEVSGVIDLDPSGRLAAGTPVTLHPATFGECLPGLEEHRHLWPRGAYLGSASTTPHTQGGMVEKLVVAASMVRELPTGLPLRRAALAEPLGVALHGIAVAGGVRGRSVLVSGSGPIGLLAAAAALAHGAAEVVCSDVLEGPLGRARALGVHGVIRAGQDPMPVEHFDVALECAGVPAAVNAALGALKRRGILAQVGMLPAGGVPIEMSTVVSRELSVRGCFRFNDEVDAAITMLAANPRIEQVITHEVGLDDALAGFATAADAQVSGKVLVRLGEEG
ncbi:zinc-binding dehydrogenase [Mariniluteicoccus flavus]